MKKRDLLFAGLLLFGVSAFAQPQRTAQDPEVVFEQTFEANWATWSTEEIDRIEQMQYYINDQTGTKSNFEIWAQANSTDFNWNNMATRDTLMILRNGVVFSDEEDSVNYKKDKYTILEDITPERASAFDMFGEDGGSYVFQYISDTCHYSSWAGSQDYSPNYRRNLFVRGLPIQDSTSYRLTFYVKAKKRIAASTTKPRLYADVMRGYFHAEKPFSMGLQDKKEEYKYKSTYVYEKRGWGEPTDDDPDPFAAEDQWEKVTFMTCYWNDSIADSFVFLDGYWWNNGWTWAADAADNPTGKNLIYTRQPDKFFVRISFSSDDTEFQLDNLSLTKSTIGGIEYSGDILRVDFGYKTNLGDLAMAAYAQNKIDAVEVVNDKNYFEVWGKLGEQWSKIPIKSAEYHGDGYMYMFTQEKQNGDPLTFDIYDSVLVSFKNPVDKDALKLKYTGDGSSSSKVFPFAWDTAWIKAGKLVPDFYNEVGKKNPYAVAGVFSMKNRPPVIQEMQFEDNSFGLDENTNSIWIKMSKQPVWDNDNPTKNLIATLGGERLTPSWQLKADGDGKEGTLTLTRTGSGTLAGDLELKLSQIKGTGTPYTDDVTYHFHFGNYTRFEPAVVVASDWRAGITEEGLWDRPVSPGVAYYAVEDGLRIGDGKNQYTIADDGKENYTKLGLYQMNDNEQFGDCFFYLAGRKSGKFGNLYVFENLSAGSYILSFPAFGWGTTSSKTHIKVYKKPAEPADMEDWTYETLDGISGKNEIGLLQPGYQTSWSNNDPSKYDAKYLDWMADTKIFSFVFTVAEPGEYVIEWAAEGKSSSYQGVAVGNYTISTASNELWFNPTNTLNDAVKAAQAYVDKAEKDAAATALYGGADLTALKAKIEADKIGGSFTSHKPSEWAAETKALNDATKAYADRMGNLDKMKTALDSVTSIKTTWAAAEEAGMLDYRAAVAGAEAYASVDYTALTADSITKSTDALNALIKNFNDYRAKYAELVKNKAAAEETKAKYTDYAALAEYKAIDDAFELYADFDAIGSGLDTLTKVTAAFGNVGNALAIKMISRKVIAVQIQLLDEFITGLDAGVEVPEDVKGLNELLSDKVAFYTLYAKDAILYAAADGYLNVDASDPLDLSCFVSNYQFLTPLSKDFIGEKGAIDNCVLDVVPGWKYTFEKGHPYIGGGNNYGGNAAHLPATGDIANTWFTIDWNTGFYLEQEVANLPAGQYTLGVGYQCAASANQGDMKVYQADTILAQTVLNQSSSTKMDGTNAPNNFLDFESAEGVKIVLHASCGNNGWYTMDNVQLMLKALPDAAEFDYDEAIFAVEDEIADMMTNVAPVKAAKAAKYYNINGVEQSAPKAGLNIKVVDGVATKVFVK